MFMIDWANYSMQLSIQSLKHGEYGKGVDDILVKKDSSLPLFVALVWVNTSLS